MIDPVSLLSRLDTTIAVVGANDDRAKFGSMIYRDLKGKGFTCYPVNPNRGIVDGDSTYRRVDEIGPPPTLINFVVPPDVTLKVLRQCRDAGLLTVWLQPGSGNTASLSFLQENGFNYVADTCIMVLSHNRQSS